ncbi:MAG: ABC transporter substrate-binding protein [Prochloraceae cyanobacterium]
MYLNRRNVLFGLTGFSLALIAASCSQPSETTTESSGKMPEKIRIGYQVSANGELLAKAMELAKEAFPDTEVEYINFASGRDVNTAMAANGIDLGLIGSVGASVGVAQNLPYQVYFIHSVIGEAEALAVRKNISSIDEIRGKKIAVPFGSTTHFSFLSLLKMENLDEKQVTVLDLQPQDMVAAWKRGDIDGGYIWYPHLQKLIDGGGKILITSADMAKKGTITADLGIVRKQFIEQYPDAVKKYVEVLDEAINFYRKNPEEAAEKISSELGLSPEESKLAIEKLIWLTSEEQADPKYLGTPEQPGAFAQVLKDSADFMVTQKTIKSAPELKTYESIIRNEFL